MQTPCFSSTHFDRLSVAHFAPHRPHFWARIQHHSDSTSLSLCHSIQEESTKFLETTYILLMQSFLVRPFVSHGWPRTKVLIMTAVQVSCFL